MASSQQPETSQQNQSQESKQAEPPQSGGDKVRYDPVGYVQHHDERSTAGSDPAHDASLTAASTSFTDGTPDSDASSTETNRDADGDDDQKDGDTAAADEGDDAVDDSEDLDEETVFVRKSTSFYRRRQSTSDTRLQQVLGFPFRPLVRPLTISDIDSCEALENAAFSKEHAATREKFEYRLTTCPELCLGLFCTVPPSVAEEHGLDIATYKTAKPVETGRPNGSVSVLVAHVVSTKCAGDLITDEAMDYPRNFKTNKGVPGPKGHQPQGHTVALHSLAVYPKLHGCGLGKLIVKAYLQHVKGAAVADRVSLICQDYLVRYYEKHGFQNVGKSPSQYGGGGWHDMTFVFGKEKPVTYGSGR